MLSSVLNSERAIEVNIHIMRAFVKRREMIASHKDLAKKLDDLEKKYDTQFKIVFDTIDIANIYAFTPFPSPIEVFSFIELSLGVTSISSVPVEAFLKFLRALPIPLASSGSFLPPNRTITIANKISNSCNPRPNIICLQIFKYIFLNKDGGIPVLICHKQINGCGIEKTF